MMLTSRSRLKVKKRVFAMVYHRLHSSLSLLLPICQLDLDLSSEHLQ